MGFLFDLVKNTVFKQGPFGNTRTTVFPQTEERIKKDWANINILLKGRSPSQLKQALLTADRTLDDALKDISEGTTMGERLKNAKLKFDRNLYSKIWEAHKMRNSMVHEANFEPPYYVIQSAVETIREALKSIYVRI